MEKEYLATNTRDSRRRPEFPTHRHRPFRGRFGLFALLALSTTPLAAEMVKAVPVSEKRVPGDRAFGEYLSSLCVTCHQISGQATGGIPPIIAWPEDQFIAVVNSYRWKERDNLVMQTVTAQLTDEEVAALAAYFASLPNRPEIK